MSDNYRWNGTETTNKQFKQVFNIEKLPVSEIRLLIEEHVLSVLRYLELLKKILKRKELEDEKYKKCLELTKAIEKKHKEKKEANKPLRCPRKLNIFGPLEQL